jgi:hypothetical protein
MSAIGWIGVASESNTPNPLVARLVAVIGRLRCGHVRRRTWGTVAFARPVPEIHHATALRAKRPMRIARPRAHPPAHGTTNFSQHAPMMACRAFTWQPPRRETSREWPREEKGPSWQHNLLRPAAIVDAPPRIRHVDHRPGRINALQRPQRFLDDRHLLIARERLTERMPEGPAHEQRARRTHLLGDPPDDRDGHRWNAGRFDDSLDQSDGPIAQPSRRRQQHRVDAVGA